MHLIWISQNYNNLLLTDTADLEPNSSHMDQLAINKPIVTVSW